MDSPPKRSITDKLKSLGIVKPARDLLHEKPDVEPRLGIDSVVDGDFLSTPLGDVFVVEQKFTSDYLHGSSPILSSLSLSLISQWANDPRIADLPLSEFAFLDTET